MSYEKQVWIDKESPLNAERMNHIEEGIGGLSEEIDALKNAATISETGAFVELDCTTKAQMTVSAETTEAVTLFHSGKNMLPALTESKTSNGTTFTPAANGKVTISGTPTVVTFYDIATKANPLYIPAGTYAMIPYDWAGETDAGATKLRLSLEDVNGSSVFYKAVSTDAGISNFTVEEGHNCVVYYAVNTTFDEEVTVGAMLIRTDTAVTTKPDYEPPLMTYSAVTLPTTLTAHRGANILYTSGGDELTVKIGGTSSKKSSFDFTAYGLPILYLNGDTSAMTKDDAVDLEYAYGDLTGTASVKWQGSSSLNYPKKNYTIKFDQEFEAVEGWGAHKKYCMKANFIDFSHSRNIAAAKLWGQIVASRTPANETLAACPNYGAIDGFPIIIAINDEFAGVYTFNIPKDGYMMNMGSGEQEAILCADANSEANLFKAEAVVGGDKTDFELEYTTDEDNTGWVQTSLNNLINACIASDGTDLDTTIATMLDWESAIDYFIFSALIDNRDGISKNYLINTYDGTKWFFTAYDMDSIFGLYWNGKSFLTALAGMSFGYLKGAHRLAELILTYKKDALKARYKEIRAGAMSEDNVALLLRNFAGQIPRAALNEDNLIWPTIPNTNTNTVQQAIDWYRLRVAKIDAEVEAM